MEKPRKTWNEILNKNKNQEIDKNPALDAACKIQEFNLPVIPKKPVRQKGAGTFGTAENLKKTNKSQVKEKEDRGDFYKPYSGYVFHPHHQIDIFVDNQLVAENQWNWWHTMPLNLISGDMPEEKSEKDIESDDWNNFEQNHCRF